MIHSQINMQKKIEIVKLNLSSLLSYEINHYNGQYQINK